MTNANMDTGQGKEETAIQELITQVACGLDNSKKVATLFLDLTKAFDRVDHDILLYKLHCYGLRGNTQRLLKSYLTNRSVAVLVGQESSERSEMRWGVPQGSVLGPVLFTLYIDNIFTTGIKGQLIAYADDICVTWMESTDAELLSSMNQDIVCVNNYMLSQKLSISDKSRVLIYSINDDQDKNEWATNIQYQLTEDYKYLGVVVDSRLKWDLHINQLTKLTRSGLRAIYSLSRIAPPSIVRAVYKATIQSHLIYGLAVWGSSSSMDRLESTVRRVSKNLCVMSMSELYKWRCLSSMCTVNVARPVVRNPRLSTIDIIKIDKMRTAFRAGQFPVPALRIFNSLPPWLRTSFFKFRNEYKKAIRAYSEKISEKA